jgi:signal transduction histidine kinase/HAMP domain-containing protein
VRLGIRAKQIAAVTATVGIFVVVLSALYVSQLAKAVLVENQKMAQFLADQVFDRALVLVRDNPDPIAAIRADPYIHSLLESSIYARVLNRVSIVDANDLVVVSDDPDRIGKPVDEQHPELSTLVNAGLITQLTQIYLRDGPVFEYRRAMSLSGDPSRKKDEFFGTIRVGVNTIFVRDQLKDLLLVAMVTGILALSVAVIVAVLMAQLLLKPIHVIRSGLTRLGKGEFGVTLDLPPGDEFGELGSFFNTVSQQLSADRSLLAGQKANLQSAVEHLEDAVALFDPSGQLLFSNPAMQPTLPQHAIGRALQGLLPAGHPYRGLVEETLAMRVSRGPVEVKNPQQQERRTDEEDLLVMTHAVAGTDGSLVGVLLVARNLAHLSRMQSTLAYSRKLVALGRLTAGIAHEVKNPLNAMMIHLELLRTKIRNSAMAVEPPPAVVAGSATTLALSRPAISPSVQGTLEHVEIIESEIRRLDEVVQGFLKFTRPEDLRLQPVRVGALFDEILPLIEPEARTNNVRVAIECPASVPDINADAGMLRQAFMNLAINACQAMPNGGSLRLVCAAARKQVEVRFEDTGVGIPPENLQKIFDLYFTTKHHGTGIGLSMVYRIVQLHDGEIEVRSTPGRGTTFRVLLPRALER